MKTGPFESLLLDINVLVALAWPTHQAHAIAAKRMAVPTQRWATCAITELGFIRLSSNPAVAPDPVSPATAAALLAEMVRDPFHAYLDKLPAPANSASVFAGFRGHKQVTDAYLLRVARQHHARFLTLDYRLRGEDNVEVIA